MRKHRTAAQEAERWTAENNTAVCELLDHIARELAEEYVRLMKNTDQVSRAKKEGSKE